MTGSERYVKIVEWSDEDGAFVGQCPGIIGPCCHGPTRWRSATASTAPRRTPLPEEVARGARGGSMSSQQQCGTDARLPVLHEAIWGCLCLSTPK
jgi:hypothetical protein